MLIGVDVELQRRMAEGLHTSARPSDQEHGAPKNAAEVQSEVKQDKVLGIGAPNMSALKEQHDSPAAFNVRDLLVRSTGARTHAIRPVSRIEDAFTAAERDLLRWLWERARPLPVSPKLRLLTGPNGEGARRLAAQAGLIYNTFKNLTRALSTKFALDIVKPEKNLPAIYAVYHESAILERQRQMGFTGVLHKNGGGRELVDAQARPAMRRPDLRISELELIIGAPNMSAPATVTPNTGAPNFC